MTKTYEFKTQRGANIKATITVEHITEREINADGHKVEVKCSEWIRTVDGLTINGETKTGTLTNYGAQRVIQYGTLKQNGTVHPLLILVPDEIVKELYDEENTETKERAERARKVYAEYDAHASMIRKAMQEY